MCLKLRVDLLRGASPLRRAVLVGSVGTLGLRLTALGLTFTWTLLLARLLGAQEYGMFAWSFAWATLLQLASVSGMDQLLARDVSTYRTHNELASIRGLLHRVPIIVFTNSIVVSIIAAIVALVTMDDGPLRATFLLALVLVPPLALTTVRQGAMQGLGRVAIGRVPDDVLRQLAFVLLIVLASSILGANFSALWSVGLEICAAIIAFVAGTVLLLRSLPALLHTITPVYDTRAWLTAAFPLWLVGGFSILLVQVDLVMVGMLRPSSDAGLYSVAARVASVVGLVEFAVNATFAPIVASLIAASKFDQLRRAASKVTAGGFVLTLVMGIAIYVGARPIMGLFGPSFVQGALVLRLLCISYILSATTGLNGTLLMMSRHGRETAWGTAGALIVNVVLNIVLIPPYGPLGAAYAWIVTVIVWNVLLVWQVQRVFGFNATLLTFFRNTLARRGG